MRDSDYMTSRRTAYSSRTQKQSTGRLPGLGSNLCDDTSAKESNSRGSRSLAQALTKKIARTSVPTQDRYPINPTLTLLTSLQICDTSLFDSAVIQSQRRTQQKRRSVPNTTRSMQDGFHLCNRMSRFLKLIEEAAVAVDQAL